MLPGFGLGEINQHGYVVSSVAAAAAHYAELVGAGPFYVGEFTLDNYHYRGIPKHCRLKIATGYWGAMLIEFIEPIEAKGTLYDRILPQHDGHLNHFGINVADIDGWLAKRGLADRVIQDGELRQSGMRFVYLDSLFPGNIHLEVIQAPPGALENYAAMAKASAAWDGRDPVRPMSALPGDLAAAR
jgi:methylmalonyl-CoA/ethylmalonyl-CoA epimerase